MKLIFALIVMLLTAFFACAENENLIPLLSIKGIHWSNEEIAYIKDLNRKGSIKIATKIDSAVYMPQADGSTKGFHFGVLKAFADLVNIDIDIKEVTWDEYFYKKGEDLEKVKSDPNYTYVPALLENVDLYVDGITALPWREKMFDIVKYVPSRQMIVSRKENKPINITDLSNKVCAMVKDTSMNFNLIKIKHTYDIEFSCLEAQDFNEMDKIVSEGRADFTVYDSDRAFVALKNYENLTIAWPVSELQVMGWGVNKKNKNLKHILEKYMKHAQQSGILDKYWKRSYGVTFVEYLKILNLGAIPH